MKVWLFYQGTSFKPIKYATVLAIMLTAGVKIIRKIIMKISGRRKRFGAKKPGIETNSKANKAKSS